MKHTVRTISFNSGITNGPLLGFIVLLYGFSFPRKSKKNQEAGITPSHHRINHILDLLVEDFKNLKKYDSDSNFAGLRTFLHLHIFQFLLLHLRFKNIHGCLQI